jgi:hypothetical protein
MRTMHAVADTYWWPGYTVDVRRTLVVCEICSRVHAVVKEVPKETRTEVPSGGIFYLGGLDHV